MSLLSESLLGKNMEDCTIMDKTTVSDGYGGVETTWTDGAKFQAALVLDNSMEAMVAMQQGVTAVYTVTTSRNIVLWPQDVFKRNSDGRIFRVVSDGVDKKTPQGAGLDMRQVRAEKWSL